MYFYLLQFTYSFYSLSLSMNTSVNSRIFGTDLENPWRLKKKITLNVSSNSINFKVLYPEFLFQLQYIKILEVITPILKTSKSEQTKTTWIFWDPSKHQIHRSNHYDYSSG